MKMKLFLGRVFVQMNAISEIKILDKMYYKKDYVSPLQIQDFYRFIRDNKHNINYIKSLNYLKLDFAVEYHLEDGLLHNLDHYALFKSSSVGNYCYYYIKGEPKSEKEWEESPERQQKIRGEKLKRILSAL